MDKWEIEWEKKMQEQKEWNEGLDFQRQKDADEIVKMEKRKADAIKKAREILAPFGLKIEIISDTKPDRQ